MKIFRASTPKAALEQIPDDERVLYVLLGHLANELNVLNKFFFFSSHFDTTKKWLTRAHTMQSLLFARLLIGKISEGWQLLQQGFFGTKLSKTFETAMTDAAKSALDNLKRYFGKDNLITNARNRFSFHYSLADTRTALKTAPDSDEWEIYLAEQQVNGLYYVSEIITSYALLEMIEPGDHRKAMDRLVHESSQVVGWLLAFIGGYMIVITEKYFLDENGKLLLEPIDIGGVPSADSIEIPYFVSEEKIKWSWRIALRRAVKIGKVRFRKICRIDHGDD